MESVFIKLIKVLVEVFDVVFGSIYQSVMLTKSKRFDDRVSDLLIKTHPKGLIKFKFHEQVKTLYMTMCRLADDDSHAHINVRIPFTSKAPFQCQCQLEWNHRPLHQDQIIAQFTTCCRRPFKFQCMVDMIELYGSVQVVSV